jgi:ribosomal protein S18 acetylase RimI-like enzyme
MMEIAAAVTPGHLAAVRDLFREYARSLGVDLGFQGFEAELAGLPGRYGAPGGALLLAVEGYTACGCVALRPLAPGVCEMKRLFVRPDFRSRGLGRTLAERILREGARRGYAVMRLDTLSGLTEAIRLYERLGFRRTDAYYDNPLPGVSYWEIDLKTCGPREETP